ncbi:cutinase, partial [Lasiosphaeria hispida]
VGRRQNFGGTTQNGLDGACKAVTVIFARGTTEAGNVGSLVGPPFFQALATAIGADKLSVQGVDYPADIPGFLAGGDGNGSKKMAELITTAMIKCPNTKVVMSGYSQGGQLVHNAAKLLPAATTAKIAAAVIFGDPSQGDAVQGVPASKTRVFCNLSDNICSGGILVLPAHLTYGVQNAAEASAF